MTSFCVVCYQPAGLRCSRCQAVYYCGEEHQRDDWKNHTKNSCLARALNDSVVKSALSEACSTVSKKSRKRTVNAAQFDKRLSGSAQFYGFFVDLKPEYTVSSGVSAEDAMREKDHSEYISFYIAYSTWDGPFLYIDRIGDDDTPDPELRQLSLRVLVLTAKLLGCSRLVWQHYQPLVDGEILGKPETLHGWLTLHWSRKSMVTFLGKSPDVLSTNFSGDPKKTISECLASIRHEKTVLRLATESDLESIERLVHGLAVYEKEPDAVHVSIEHYRRDGFGDNPLFHCLLVDSIGDDSQPYTCGMAFCYIGKKRREKKHFWYLEDLFIEETHRGSGRGSLVMRALAEIALCLDCEHCVWQALDWNTPALTFYDKIGAKVVDNLITSRYMGEALQECASLDP